MTQVLDAATVAVTSEPDHRDEPVVVHRDAPEEELTEAALGRAMAFGFTGGTIAMTLATLVMCLIAGASLAWSAAISVVPGLVAGLFLGGTVWMGHEVSKLHH